MDGYVVIGTELDTKKFDAQIKEVEYELKQIDYELSHAKELKLDSRTIEEYQVKAEKLTNKLVELRKKQEDLNRTDLTGIKSSISNIGNSIETVIHKITRWGLAIFGIRSAYMFVRQAMSTLTQYDTQMATNVEWIRYLLASALKPVIETLINLAYKLLVYINYISQAWFGINLFANATTKAFQKQNKTMGGTLKQAKELQKTLTGFDEMNILQKDGSVGAGGGGGGVDLGSLEPDFTPMDKVEIPGWIKWIADNKELILSTLGAIALAIAGIKLANLIGPLAQIHGLSKMLLGLGIAVAIYGVVQTIKALIEFIKDPSLQNFGNLLDGISTAIMGVSVALIALNASNPIGWILLLISAIGKLAGNLLSEEKAILSVKDATEKLKEAKDKLRRANDDYIEAVDREKETGEKLIEVQNRTGISGEELYKKVQDGTLDYKDMTDAQKEVYKAYYEHIKAQEDVVNASKNLKKAKTEEKDATWDDALAKKNAKGEINKYRDAVVQAWDDGKISTKQAQKYLSKAMTEMDAETKQTFGNSIPNEIRQGLDPGKYQTTWQNIRDGFRSVWNGVSNDAKAALRNISTFATDIEFTTKSTIKKIKSGKFAKGGVVYHTLPKLASGGIINQPGRGVPIGQAIGGERGAEGVMPLTDSQQMALLGEAIGRYITVTANITNTMNGRIISRELQKVQNDSDFAFNR